MVNGHSVVLKSLSSDSRQFQSLALTEVGNKILRNFESTGRGKKIAK